MPGRLSTFRVETFVLDRALGERLYDYEVEVSFVKRIRDELKFDGADALIEELARAFGSRERSAELDARPRPAEPGVSVPGAPAGRRSTLAKPRCSCGKSFNWKNDLTSHIRKTGHPRPL